jgi:RNA polymerase sigma-70 factor, ECF subfamily
LTTILPPDTWLEFIRCPLVIDGPDSFQRRAGQRQRCNESVPADTSTSNDQTLPAVAAPKWGGLPYRVLPRLPRYEFDRGYVERLVSEDPDTERHFTRYFGELLSLKLRSRLRSAALVEDARQETFSRVLIALKQKGGMAAPETLGAFVNSVCNNVLFEMYRSGSRMEQLDETFDAPDEREPAADARIMSDEERIRVRDALAALPQKERDLLRWLFFEDRDKDAVCRELNIDRNYLRVLLHRAKMRFRAQFTAEDRS